ncbi:MAG: hypothetical protein ACMUEL_09145 [Flavobacteriales bacterium Tduv]
MVEGIFRSIKNWFGSEKSRYKRLVRMRTQHLMEAMAHNLYRPLALLCAIHKNRYN